MASSSVNKSGPRVKVGGRKPRADDMLFGTDAEVEDRDPNKSLYSEFLPNTNPPAFSQIKPEVSTGKSVNRSGFTTKSGDFKFSSGPGKPQVMGIDPSAMQGGGGPPGMGGPPGAGGPPGGGGAPDPMALLALAKLSRRKRHPGGKKGKGKRRK